MKPEVEHALLVQLMISNNEERAFLGSTGVLLLAYLHIKCESRSQFCSTSVIELVSYRRFRVKRPTRSPGV